MSGHKRQCELVADIDGGIRHDLGAARRDVQDESVGLRRSVVEREPGLLLVKLPPRFTRDF
jgi:hypothetical protein